MPGFDEIIGQVIEAKLKQVEKMSVTLGTVTQVRELDCDVSRQERPELLGVKYHAVVNSLDNYIRITPKQGSQVLCAMIENNESEAVIIAYSEIETVTIKIKDAEFTLQDGKFTVNNKDANLKQILNTGFDTLINAVITTPGGPGEFSPADITKFEELKIQTLKLLS